jgi:hypothetical protein
MADRAPSAAAAPLVSVVIPTYNCEPYIRETIESVLAQRHRPIEVIVVDDGSSDRTPDIAASFGEPVRVVRQINQRVCAARNRGFAESKGEFVCFLDHDDVWFPWKLSRQLEAFAARPDAGVVFTEFLNWFPGNDGRFPEPASLAPADDGLPPFDPEHTGWIYHQFMLDCWALTSSAMIRREVFAASGGFDPALPYSEDWDLWLRLAREVPFVRLARVSTLYRQHPGQGNRVLRPVDYRTRMLEAAARRWGLASRDGRSVPEAMFHHRLAAYHMEFGLHQLRHAQLAPALGAFLRAWRHHPGHWKYPALLLASLAGWRPRAAG